MRPRSLAALVAVSLLGALALAIAQPSTAAAGTNNTVTWCKPRPVVGETILASADSVLVWRPEGVLALEPAEMAGGQATIWQSPAGETLCFAGDGRYQIKNAAGAVVWTKGTAYQSSMFDFLSYKLKASISQCTVRVQRVEYMGSVPVGTSLVWQAAVGCPELSESNVVNGAGWCLDTSKRRVLARSPLVELVWQTHGGLNLLAVGSRSGQLWGSGTYQIGKKICFENDGRLTIYDASDAVAWRSTTTGFSTSTDYALGIDGCSLSIRPLDGGAVAWETALDCPHDDLANGTWTRSSVDQVLLENEDATVTFGADGLLRLRSRSGDEYWNSSLPGQTFTYDGYFLNVKAADGSLVMTTTAGPKTRLVGCQLQTVHPTAPAALQVSWSQGVIDCDHTSLQNTRGYSSNATGARKGEAILLRNAEAYLAWQWDGNLVLYTTGGQALWSSGTYSSDQGRSLGFHGYGYLFIYVPNTSTRLWTFDFMDTNTRLRLLDDCTLVLQGDTKTKTIHSSCRVQQYSFEENHGDDTFGTSLSSDVASDSVAGVKRVDTVTRLYLTIFGYSYELFEATAYESANTSVGSLSIGPSSGLSLNFTYEKEFFKREQTFWLGPVPVNVEAGAIGTVTLSATYPGGGIEITPSASLSAVVKAGVGGGIDGVAEASAGVYGQLTLIELAFPIESRVFTENGTVKFSISGSIAADFLAGSLGLYAEATILFASLEWTMELVSWAGVSYEKELFSKTASF